LRNAKTFAGKSGNGMAIVPDAAMELRPTIWALQTWSSTARF